MELGHIDWATKPNVPPPDDTAINDPGEDYEIEEMESRKFTTKESKAKGKSKDKKKKKDKKDKKHSKNE